MSRQVLVLFDEIGYFTSYVDLIQYNLKIVLPIRTDLFYNEKNFTHLVSQTLVNKFHLNNLAFFCLKCARVRCVCCKWSSNIGLFHER